MIFKPPYNGLYFIFLKFYGPEENDENLKKKKKIDRHTVKGVYIIHIIIINNMLI